MKDTPSNIESSIAMSEANTPFEIHKGEFYLKNKDIEIKVKGSISFKWIPSLGQYFSGEVITKSNNNNILSWEIVEELTGKEFKVINKDLKYGRGIVIDTTINKGSNHEGTFIKGKIHKPNVVGDKSITVEKMFFSIPNLREIHGSVVKSYTNRRFLMARLELENDDYIITIDKCPNYKAKLKSLKDNGGYIILYSGELKRRKGPVNLENTEDIFHCLNAFITFLNGRRTATVFLQGIYEDDVKWIDYSNKIIDPYKHVHSWPQKYSTNGLNELWQRFSSLWKNTDDKNFLETVIHWYIEANSNSGFTEGSIIMAQTALELLYNWWIVEDKKLIIGEDAKKMSASNKIRLLLSQLNISHLAPDRFTELQELIDNDINIIDAPDAIVQIRNAIVHSQEEKRRKIIAIHPHAKHEALELSIWYIEMALLRILNYDGKYMNRCSIENNEEYVPWVDKVNIV